MVPDAEKVLEKITQIECGGIVLRRFTQDDAASVLEYGSDAETVKWLVWEGVKNIDGALESLNGFLIANAGAFAVTLKENGKCIGSISLRLNT